MKPILQHQSFKWLVLASLIGGALTACPAPTPNAVFSVTASSLSNSLTDGQMVSPVEAIVKNTSSIAGVPPLVSFNISSDLEFLSLNNPNYTCDATSEILLTCTAKEGVQLEGQAQTTLQPVFDLVFKNVDPLTAAQSKSHTLTVPISVGSAVLVNPITLIAIPVVAAASGFDLIIDKTISKPFVVNGSGIGTGEFTLTASLGSTPPPFPNYVKIQDPALPAGYAYNWATILARNTSTSPVYPWNCVKTGPLAGPWGVSCTLKPAFLNTYPYPALTLPVLLTPSPINTVQLNCPWLYPLLGDSVNNNNHLGPAPYAKPCVKYEKIRSDLAISKTQTAPLTTPANSFYWDLPGKYQIIVSNTTSTPATGTVTVSDILTNIPNGAVMAFTTALTDIFLAVDGWTISGATATNTNGWSCTGTYPNIICSHAGPVPANGQLPPLILGVKVKPENAALAQGETNCAALITQATAAVAATPINDANNQNNKSCVDSQNMALEGFDLSIKKDRPSNASVTPGGVINYVLAVANSGTGDAPGPIVVTDTLPAAFSSTPTPTVTVSPSSAATCSVIGLAITCTSTGSLPTGSSFNISITATTKTTATGSITNTAVVTSGAFAISEVTLQNNTSSHTFIFPAVVQLHRAESIVRAANGDYIVVGSADSATRGKQFMTRRYQSDGATVVWEDILDLSANHDTALDVALDSTGNIVVVGYANGTITTNTQAVMVKYSSSGVPLGTQTVGTQTDGFYDYFGSVAIDSSNRIVTGGFDQRTAAVRDRFVVRRYTPSLILDTTFNSTGRVETDVMSVLGLGSASQGVNDVLIEEAVATGLYRIYAAGVIRPSGTITAIARYTQTGALDTSWGGVGAIQTSIPSTGGNIVYEIGLQRFPLTATTTVTRLVGTGTHCVNDCVGETEPNQSCFVVAYQTSNGAVDTTFGTGGISNFGASNATGGKACTAMAIHPSTNEIAVTGSSFSTSTGADYMARMLTPTGALSTMSITDNPNTYAALSPRDDRSQGVVWNGCNIMTAGFSYENATNTDEWVVKQFGPPPGGC